MEKVALKVPITVVSGLLLHQAIRYIRQQEISELLLKVLPVLYLGWTIN